MTELSPSARAVLTAVTLKKYDVPPEGLPAFAEEMAPLIAAALRAAVRYCQSEYWSEGEQRLAKRMLMISDELEA